MTGSRYQRMRVCGKSWAGCSCRNVGAPVAVLWEFTSKPLCGFVLHKAEHISEDASVAMVTIRNSTTYIYITQHTLHFADSDWRPFTFRKVALSFTPYHKAPPRAMRISCFYKVSFSCEMLSQNSHCFYSQSES